MNRQLIRPAVESVKRDIVWAFRHTVLNTIAGSVWVPRVLRLAIYRVCGLDIRTPNIMSGVVLRNRNVSIAPQAFVNWGTLFEGDGLITIGPRTQVAEQVSFITAGHPLDETGRPTHEYQVSPITVGADCWLGTRVTVLSGVSIADGCTVAAGAVVTRDLTEPGVYAGVPARLVRPSPLPAEAAG